MVTDTRGQKLQNIIENGQKKVYTVMNDIQEEFSIRKDYVAKPESIKYQINDNDFQVFIDNRESKPLELLNFTNFSRNQVLNRLNIPVNYAAKLQELGEGELLLDTLNKLTAKQCKDGLLFRQINNRIKGVLSPSYRRMDAAPIFESFIESSIKAGYAPYQGDVTDYRYNISFILPEVFQVGANEFCVLGVAITTSDYGSNALQVELVCLRISCLNLCIGNDVMRSVHLGKRFNTEESFLRLSSQTHSLDNKTVASAVSDSVKASIDLQTEVRNRILQAAEGEKEINIDAEIKKLRQKGVRKEVAEAIKATYESPLPVEILPQEKNSWRLSNAISFLANSQSPDVKLDLQKAAYNVI